jgi:zinc transport system substrate-binding protein
MLKHLIALGASIVIATPVMSKPLKVVTDIAPIYSLVSQVMGGSENITLLLDSGSSPHDFALKPSQAKALQDSDLVIFIGLALTPWMEKPLTTLANSSKKIALLDAPETVQYEMRESNVFDDDHHDHAHDHSDPHAWMDTRNAQAWLIHIAKQLAAFDVENSENYMKNSAKAVLELQELETRIARQLSPFHDQNVMFFHDAYQYFEHRFDLNAVGAVTLADDAKVTPKQLRSIEGLFKEHDIKCVLVEHATKQDWINLLAGHKVSQAPLDPLGALIPLNADFYVNLIQKTADQITNCLKAT